MKQIASSSSSSDGKVVGSKAKPHPHGPGTRSVKLGCGLECHWGAGGLRARVIAFLNDGAGITGVMRRIFRRDR